MSVTSRSYSNYFRVPINSGNPYADGVWYKGTSLSAYYGYDMLMKLGSAKTQIEQSIHRVRKEEGFKKKRETRVS